MSLNIFSALKPLNGVVHLGDSRRAQNHADGLNLRKTGYDFFNYGNAVAGNRLFTMGSLGVSGDRGDQVIGRVALAIASGAGTMMLQSGVNSIGAANVGYTRVNTVGPNIGVAVTLANVATIEAQDQQFAIQRFIGAGGRKVIMVIEAGSENFNAAQLAALRQLQQYQRQLARNFIEVLPFDLPKFLVDTAASTTTTNRFKAGFMQEAAGSGTHTGNLGGQTIGVANFAPFVVANFPDAIPFLPNAPFAIAGNGIDLLNNPLFTTVNGGSLGAGITAGTGTTSGPGSYAFVRASGGSGTQTGVISVQAASDGSPGNECIIAATSGAAGDDIRMNQDVALANVNIGDTIQGVARITVDAGGVALAAAYIEMQYNDGALTFIATDLVNFNNAPIGTAGHTVDVATEPFTITSKGAGFCTLRLHVIGSAAGAHPNVRVKQFQMLKFQP